MRGAVGLTPLTVFIAILAGTEFAGIPGALLAIPIAAIIQVMLSHYTEAQAGGETGRVSALPGWRWMRGSVSPPAFSPLAPETSSDWALTARYRRRPRTAHRDGAPMCCLAQPARRRSRSGREQPPVTTSRRHTGRARAGRGVCLGHDIGSCRPEPGATRAPAAARRAAQRRRPKARIAGRLDDRRRAGPSGVLRSAGSRFSWSDSRAKASLPRRTITRRSTPLLPHLTRRIPPPRNRAEVLELRRRLRTRPWRTRQRRWSRTSAV